MNDRAALLCPDLDKHNDSTAVFVKGRAVSYGELARKIDNLAANIMKTGVARGSRIALSFENTIAFIYSYMAILEANCIPVLLSPNLPAEKLIYILTDCDAAAMICDCRVLHKVSRYPSGLKFVFTDGAGEALAHSGIAVYSLDEGISSKKMRIENHYAKEQGLEVQLPDTHSIASIIYTSGTTGKPKGVMLSDTNLLLATSTIMRHLCLTPEDSCLVTMSFAHCAGLLHMLAHLRAGAKVVTDETFTLIGPFLAAVSRHCVTILPGVPSFYTLLSKHSKHKIRPYLQNIRAVESSSAMISSSLINEVADLFPSATLFNTYGLTEAPRATYMTVDASYDTATNLSVGTATSGVTISIVNHQNQHCRAYEEGEIVIKGANLALGYWNNPVKTQAVFSSLGFRTGDVGYMNEKGLLFLKGRKDDMIKIGAEAVYPYEVEEVIGSFPGVSDVLAYGVEDDIRGSVIHVKIVCKETITEENVILDYCCQKLEKHKVPSKIMFCDSIDLEESGKPKRGKKLS